MAPRPKIHVTFTQGRTVFRGLRRLRSERPSELTHLHKYLSGRPTNWVKDSIPATYSSFHCFCSALSSFVMFMPCSWYPGKKVSTFGFVSLPSFPFHRRLFFASEVARFLIIQRCAPRSPPTRTRACLFPASAAPPPHLHLNVKAGSNQPASPVCQF